MAEQRTQLKTLPKGLAKELANALTAYQRSRKTWNLLGNVGLLVAVSGVVVTLAMAFDRFVDVDGSWRAPLPWLALAILLVLAIKALWALCQPPDYDAAAQALDRASGDDRDHLRSLLDFARQEFPQTFFLQRSNTDAAAHWQSRRSSDYVAKQEPTRLLTVAIVVVAIFAALWHIPGSRGPLLWQRFLNPTGNHMRPTATWFELASHGEEPIYTGDDITVKATLAGREVATPNPLLQLRYADGSSITRAMQQDADGAWTVELRNLRQNFEYHLTMGPARSQRVPIAIQPRPTVASATVTYHYPKYTRLPKKTEVLNGRSITALAGTKIQLRITSNIPLKKAVGLTDVEQFKMRVNRKKPTEAILHLIINDTKKLRVDMLSADGIASKQELPFTIRAIPDNAPSINLRSQIDGKAFYVTDSIEIAYRAQDDLGLSGIFVKTGTDIKSANSDLIDIELAEYGAKRAEGKVSIPIADLQKGNAKFVQLSLLAKDSNDQDGLSRVVTIKIATDSYDRQMRQAKLSYVGHQGHNDPVKRGMNALAVHDNALKNLKSSRGQILILSDGLDPNKALGKTVAGQVSQIEKMLANINPPQLYGRFWFHDIQNLPLSARIRGYAEFANLFAPLAINGAELRAQFAKAKSTANPKGELEALLPLFDAQIKTQEQTVARVRADYQLVLRELVGYLASVQARQLGNANALKDDNAKVNVQTALKEIHENVGELDDVKPELKAALAKLSEAKDVDTLVAGKGDVEALRDAVKQSAPPLALARAQDAAANHQALLHAHGARPEFAQVITAVLYQLGDNLAENELFVFFTAQQFLRSYTGDSSGKVSNLAEQQRMSHLLTVYDDLHRFAKRCTAFRLGLATGELVLGQPEAEATWLALRESKLALQNHVAHVPAGPSKDQLTQLLSGLGALEQWLPPPECAESPFLSQLGQWHDRARAIAKPMTPEVAKVFSNLRPQIADAQKLLPKALKKYVQVIDAEIAWYTKTKKGTEYHNLNQIKLELAALNVSVLKLTDMLQMSSLYTGGSHDELRRWLPAMVAMSKLVEHFELKVESHAWTVRHIHRYDPEHAWQGKVKAYNVLKRKLDLIHQLITAPDPLAARDVLQNLGVSHGVQVEIGEVDAVADLPAKIKEPQVFVSKLADASNLAPALWSEAHFQLRLLRDQVAQRDAAGIAAAKATAGKLKPWLMVRESFPREAQELDLFIEDSEALSGDDLSAASDIRSRANTYVEDLGAITRMQHRMALDHTQNKDTWVNGLDHSALVQAKYKSRVLIANDKMGIQRTLAGLAMGINGYNHDDLPWTAVNAQLNRRKAGMILNRAQLGTTASGGDGADNIKLPKHIYQELKRAREKAMPPLFRDRCYRYLNDVLEQARR